MSIDPIERNQEVVMIAASIPPVPLHSTASYSIRPFEPADVRAWTTIQAAADRYNIITDDLFAAAFGRETKAHRDRILIACDLAGRPVGTAAAWFGDADWGAAGRLHWVAVAPDHQGRGLGRALVEQAMQRLASLGHTDAYLTTSAARLPAIHLYHTCGFVPRIDHDRDRAAWQAIARALAASGRPLTVLSNEL